MDFALMYIPSESVYYEIVNQIEVLDYARKARVYMVSPSTLYAHLQTILVSFEGKKIERKGQKNYLRFSEACELIMKKSRKICQRLENILTMPIHNLAMSCPDFPVLGKN